IILPGIELPLKRWKFIIKPGKSKMRVLFSITNLLVGGAQTFLVALANEMSKSGKVYVYCFCESQIDREITGRISPRVKLIIFPPLLRRFAPRLQKIFSIFKIKRNAAFTLRKLHLQIMGKWLKIDIIHSQLYHSDEFITDVFRDRKIPVIITEHGCYNYVIREKLGQKESLIGIFKRVDGVAHISDQNKEHIIELTGNKEIQFRKINNGIPRFVPAPGISQELRKSLQINSHDFVFGMIARGIKEKGWEIAAAAFKELQTETGMPIHLIFIGDSPYLQELKQKVGAEAVNNIHFLGSISDPVKWVDCFDIGLLPTYFAGESLPMTIIEYLACAKPIIATNAGCIKEMIRCESENAGIIFAYHTDFKINVQHLKEAMAVYLQNPGTLEKHRATAQQCFSKYDIKIICENYQQFYELQLTTKSNRNN
ncbi:MAG TPA: glycosyltransferase family 4 protein, partial [Candidatus Kapabacteria bacterium]|nr:glycosyltransferase family 4 protein [Candidatus Kapabacteria bacterium]